MSNISSLSLLLSIPLNLTVEIKTYPSQETETNQTCIPKCQTCCNPANDVGSQNPSYEKSRLPKERQASRCGRGWLCHAGYSNTREPTPKSVFWVEIRIQARGILISEANGLTETRRLIVEMGDRELGGLESQWDASIHEANTAASFAEGGR